MILLHLVALRLQRVKRSFIHHLAWSKRPRIAYGLDYKGTAQRLLIGINPGPTWRVKEWEASKWQELINKIHSEYDAVIIQFGFNTGDGSSEYDNLTDVKLLAGRLKGEELLALVTNCDLIISIDSGPVHLAGAVGTPVIGLFGPLDPALILPPNAQALGLFSDVPCLFCHNRAPIIHWRRRLSLRHCLYEEAR